MRSRARTRYSVISLVIESEGERTSMSADAHVDTLLKAASHCPEIDPRWTHENEALHDRQELFLAAKDFAKTPEVDAD